MTSGGSVSSESLHRRRTAVPREVVIQEGVTPPGPTEHMKRLHMSVQRPLEIVTCDEHHRYTYFPKSTLKAKPGRLQREETARGPEAKEGLGGRRKVWGSLDSDYGKASRDVERGWKLDAVRRAASEPGFGHRIHAVNPSLVSRGVSTSMVGGTHISLRHTIPKDMQREEARQVGLYEESFEYWNKHYKPPQHGLSQSDVTQYAGALVLQKALMRK